MTKRLILIGLILAAVLIPVISNAAELPVTHYTTWGEIPSKLVGDAIDSSSALVGNFAGKLDTFFNRQVFGPEPITLSTTARDSASTKTVLVIIPTGVTGNLVSIQLAALALPNTNQDSCYLYIQSIKAGVKHYVSRVEIDADSAQWEADTCYRIPIASLDSSAHVQNLSAGDIIYYSTWAETTASALRAGAISADVKLTY